LKLFNKKNHGSKRARCCAVTLFIWALILAGFVTNLNAASVTEGAKIFKLDNGFTVILKKDNSAPVAAIQVWVKTGSANETEEEAGITHLIEHMIFKGTPSKKPGKSPGPLRSPGVTSMPIPHLTGPCTTWKLPAPSLLPA